MRLFEAFTTAMLRVLGFRVVTPCGVVIGLPTFRMSMLPPLSGCPTQHYTPSQPRRSGLQVYLSIPCY